MIGDFLVYAFGLLAQKARDKARDEGIAKGAGLVPEERLSHLNYQLACATNDRDDYLKALQELSGIADSVVTKHHVDAIRERMKTAEKERDKAQAELAAIKEEPEPYLKASYERDFKKARTSCEAAEKERDALRAQLEAVKERAKIATQAAVECLGSVGPESVDAAMGRMVAEVDRLKNDLTRVQANQERLVRRYKRDGAPRVGDMVLTAGGFLYDVTASSAGGPRCSEDGQDIGWLLSVDVVATLAPTAPVGLWKDLWKDAVRVEKDGFAWVVKIGLSGEWIWSYSDSSKTIADEFADRIRRGLASLPPIRAVLPGGVTREMLAAYDAAYEETPWDMNGGHRRAGLAYALAVAPIQVLDPGQVVVTVRVCKEGQLFPKEAHWSDRGSNGKSWWFNPGSGIATCTQRDFRYILASDLDAAAAGLGGGK